jgi:nucleotide-binding universal stress UspA family protein
MLTVKHVLFPIDFSDRCCGAVPFVESMARRYSAKVTLLSAAQPFYFSGMGDPGVPMIDTEELLRDLDARLRNSLTNNFVGLRITRVAQLGDPSTVITEFANSRNVDLIMMPTHGYGPFRSLLLGSVTAKVLHDANCPVWTSAHTEEPPRREQATFRKILCAIDGTSDSIPLMKWAKDLAIDAEASLRLIHVVPGMEAGLARQMDREFEEELRREARITVEHLEHSAGIDAPFCVEAGNIAESVCDEAREHGADLVVIGRGVSQGTLGRLRTHAHAIIRQSPCPAISI